MRAEPSGPMGAICFGPPKRDPRPAASKTSVGAVTAPERTALWSGVHRREPLVGPRFTRPEAGLKLGTSWNEPVIARKVTRGVTEMRSLKATCSRLLVGSVIGSLA